MSTKSIILFISCIVLNVSAQTKITYIDSLEKAMTKLPEKQQLKTITKIPYGNFVAEVEKAEKLFRKAENLAFKLKDSLSLGDVVFKQGQLKAYQNKLDESIALILRAITIFEKSKNFSDAGIAYGGLGYNLKKSNLENSLYYMRKGIKLLEKNNDLKGLNPIYDNYGVVLSMSKKIDSALYYQKKSLFIKKQLKDSNGIGYSYANIANTFTENKNYTIAKIYVDSSMVIRNKIADNYGVTVSYVQKAEILMLEKKYPQAIENFKICAQLASKYKYKHLEQYCYENLAACYLEFPDYKSAYFYKDKFQTLKDSSENVQIKNKVEELQIQFETEKKEKLLAKANSELVLKEAKIKQRNSYLVSALGLAFLLGLIGYLVYKQQRLKNRQIIKESELKRALAEIENQNNLQEQRLAISKDLHDNIGSQLTFIISSLDNLKFFEFSKEILYIKFDSITAFTRSTITDLRDTIWAMNKEVITFEDLKTRTTNFIETAKTSLLGIQFEFNYPESCESLFLNSLQGIDVFRIIQESLNNAIKHSKATHVVVDFEVMDNEILITIIDNGVGFDSKEIKEGNGLSNMKKRAKEINADFIIEQLQPGTKVTLKFTLD
ncbi:ATP-binding protein [Flavobacterium sp.]|uniref:tetratricopeptide repeat-containing sensor histidine kinase n=1 Tax=Flavobacterium sp. TaxID=239 RepID=UPI0026339DA6|nr:ATP-binding protein [Flavobacterium sp.]MDG2433440.1 ATP-binding protein [Flavobacterium sp.]